MDFFYQSGAMGYGGEGYFYHKFYEFPKFPIISKTITYNKKTGNLFNVIPFRKSVWNKIGLKNMGLYDWHYNYYNPELILSFHFMDWCDISLLGYFLKERYNKYHETYKGIELNISCPNIKNNYLKTVYGFDRQIDELFNLKNNKIIENIYIKVNHKFNLNDFNLYGIDGINLNSIPMFFGGISGKMAQKKNWNFIEKWQGKRDIPNISGCSWTNSNDLRILKNMGCKKVGIGSIILTNPKLVEKL